jgi:hypothetical protein
VTVATEPLTLSRFHFNGKQGVPAMNDKNGCSGNDQESLLLQHEIEVIAGLVESKGKYRTIVKAAIAHWVKDFQGGRIKIDTVDDLKKLIEIDLELQREEL